MCKTVYYKKLCNTQRWIDLKTEIYQDNKELKKKKSLSKLGLTPNLEPIREDRTFPITRTLNGPSSQDDETKYGISIQRGIC